MPSLGEYQNVLGNLNVFLQPADLKHYSCVLNKRGSPMIYSGGFVMTSPIEDSQSGRKLALRMFHQLPDDMVQRYRAISSFINHNYHLNIFAKVDYIERGVLVNGQIYPICTMKWLEGTTLRSYVSKNVGSPQKLSLLADDFLEVMTKLRRTGGAHGDLSHENIMVVNDKIMLVDYDGMYTPDLDGFPPIVAGQENFQHPQRMTAVGAGYFGPYQDNFAAIAIYISLRALSFDATLYDRYENGGNSLLFKKSDFVDPENSDFLREIRSLDSSLDKLADEFAEVCAADLLQVPPLQDFLRGKTTVSSVVLNPSALAKDTLFSTEGNPVFDATTTDSKRLRSALGHIAVVAGRVHTVHQRTDQIMLEFRSGGLQTTFAVFIEGDAYEQLARRGNSEQYAQKWVKVTGLVELNDISGEETPCIITDSLQDVVIKTSSEILSLIRTGNETALSQPPTAPGNRNWIKKGELTTDDDSAKNPPKTGEAYIPDKKNKKSPFGGLSDS